MKNSIKKVAVFALTALFVVTTVFMAVITLWHDSQTPSAKSEVEIVVPVTNEYDKSQKTAEKQETKVLLVDASGSMSNNISAYAGYDSVQHFGDYLGQRGGNSCIYTNIVRTLDMGVKIVGVVTDLESYPASEVTSLDGKKYENISLTFYLPEDVNDNYVKDYESNWSKALDSANSTLVFVYADGSKKVVFDAYALEPEDVDEEENDEIIVKVNTEAITGDSISFKALGLILGTIIDLVCLFGILLLALIGNSDKAGKGKDVPVDIEEAFKLPVALDGSGSVANHYASMVKYAEQLKVADVWRFAEDVQKLSTDTAKNTPAGGNTSGYKCLKEMAAAGLSEIAIMTDFGFNDEPSQVDGVCFEHVTMIIPANIKVNDAIKQKIIGMCKTYKVINL